MSLFGDLDAELVSSNPYHVDEGEYPFVITDGYFDYHEAKDKHSVVVEYTITEEDSIYFQKPVREYLEYFPNMTEEAFAALDRDQQRHVMRKRTDLKRRLCGNNKDRKGLGVSPQDLNDPEWHPKVLKGTEGNMGIVNRGGENNNEFTNVKWAEAN